MKNKFQKIVMTMTIFALAVVSFVGFGPVGKASAATTRGCGYLTAYASEFGFGYDQQFSACASDDNTNVYTSIKALPQMGYMTGAGPWYYDAFLMRWDGSKWVKKLWVNGNILSGQTANRQFSNIVQSGTPTLIWVDFYYGPTSEYLGHAVTPSWVR